MWNVCFIFCSSWKSSTKIQSGMCKLMQISDLCILPETVKVINTTTKRPLSLRFRNMDWWSQLLCTSTQWQILKIAAGRMYPNHFTIDMALTVWLWAKWWHVFGWGPMVTCLWGETVGGPTMTYLWLFEAQWWHVCLRPNSDMSLAEAQQWHVLDWGPMVTCLWLFETQWWHVFNHLRPIEDMSECLRPSCDMPFFEAQWWHAFVWLFEAQWWHAFDCLRPNVTRLWLNANGDMPLTFKLL